MRKEATKEEYRCWLDESEQDILANYYEDENVIKQIAIRLMLESGLRVDEVTRVRAADIQDSGKDADFKRLQVRESKTGYRETIIPDSLANQIKTVDQVADRGEIIDVTTRTIQNWVVRACEKIAEETHDENWYDVSSHDCRRTWATSLIQQGFPSDIVMDLGGWEDHDTFREHYWKSDDREIQKHLNRINFN